MADTKTTTLSEISVPVLTDLLYAVADPGGSPASAKLTLARALGMMPFCPGGRLTTESGVSVSTTDRTAQGTLYYTPHTHTGLRLWDGARWALKSFSEISLSLTLTSGKPYDVFTNNGTSLTLSAEWTNGTTRADALGTQNGVAVLNSDKTYLHLGTIYASGSNVTADSGGNTGTTQVGGQRFVWNRYNQVPRDLKVIDLTDNWSYTTDTIRQANGASGNKVEYVTGDAAVLVKAEVLANNLGLANSARLAKAGVGVDSTSTFSGRRGGNYATVGSGQLVPITGFYEGYPGLGYHYLSWNEKGSDVNCTFYGDSGGDGTQSGLSAWLMG